ncbi:MAG TPA: RNA polymerase sigma factor [Candidatus Limnocylindria bacterium]|nr:RNA polymerase sigma factor [Candidatus Limnocylindria bacterium]
MPFETTDNLRPSTAIAGDPAVVADEQAFRAWYDRSLPTVYGYLFHRCGRDPHLAEELTQQAFVEAVGSYGRFRGQADPTTWVVGIARHKLVDHFRRVDREARRQAALSARELGQTGPALSTPPAEPDGIDDALALLPALQRAVLVLHYMDRLSVRDVARAIGKTEAATASLLARGRDAFRLAYGEAER